MIGQSTQTIPKGWRETVLEEVVSKANTGADAIRRAPIVPEDTGIKCLRIQDISQDKNFNDWGFTSVSDNDYEKFQLKAGDLMVARTGASIGVNMIIKKDLNAVFNNGLIRIRVNEKSFPEYVYFLISSKLFEDHILSISQGTSTQPNIQIGALLGFPIFLPPLAEQRAIAAVLSSLDDKIELLCEQNKTLVETAQAIFKEWFVNFNFPGATGKMVDSELGEIPDGWEVAKLTRLFDFIKGIEPGSDNYSVKRLSEDYLPFYRVQDTSNYNKTPNVFVDQKLLNQKIFKTDDILISLDGTIGRVFIGGSGGYSSGIRKVIGKESFISRALIFCFLKSDKFQRELGSFAGAETTIKHAGGAIEHIKFIFERSVCEKYGRVADPIFQKLISNISQIQTLFALRDTLLPKLMSGRVRVKGFDL